MLETTKVNHKILIFGAGPVGMYAAIRFGLQNKQVLIVESRDEVGGQCTALYKEKPLYDIPGIVEITGQDFIFRLNEQLKKYNHTIKLSTKITNINIIENNLFEVELNGSEKIIVENIIIASGGGFYAPININVNIDENIKHQIHYSVEDKSLFKNKNIAVFGGGDSAIDWALSLSSLSNNVSLIHRGKSFRGSNSNAELLNQKENIQVYLNANLKSLSKNNNSVEITLEQGEKNINLFADHILVFFGLKMENSLMSFEIKPETKNGKLIVNPTTEETSVKNLFAIGDISYYEYKKPNLTTGFGQAVQVSEYINKISC